MYSRVYVEITNICNMNCSFCHGHSRKAGRMNTDEFIRVLEKLEGQTKYIYYHLMLSRCPIRSCRSSFCWRRKRASVR